MIVLMANINDSIANIFLVGILCVVIGYILKRLHQPYLVGYIIIGVFLGPFGLDVFRSDLVKTSTLDFKHTKFEFSDNELRFPYTVPKSYTKGEIVF